jgi:ATP-dependent exoDNAse (exonuclease V) alpha subunit
MTQQDALDILQAGYNVFLTGSAGSGKTYILNRFIAYLKLHQIPVGITASTGVAATHLNGMTLNAWTGIGVKEAITDSQIDALMKRRYLHHRIRNIKVLIIDEVSMLSQQTFESVDKVFRAFKNSDEPFGGVQIVLCGDFFQLPPVTSSANENSQYIYHSPLWQELDLKICYLETPYRQIDKRFLDILEQIRNNHITKDMWDTLKNRFFQTFGDGVSPTRLYTHNSQADAINKDMLAKLDGKEFHFMMRSIGTEELTAIMKRSCLAPEQLILKRRALVMFVKNNFEEGYVNGTMGRIIDFTEKEGFPIVETFEHKQIAVRPSVWTIDEDGEVKAKLTQIPLRLAWAITIHKSQGMSLDAAEIDLGKSFVTGMGYVALSRVRKLEGIRLKSLNRTALTVNEEVIKIDKQLQKQSEEIVNELHGSK